MAILNSLIVSGASRFLNTAYFQDVSISGTANFTSISASGNITAGGNLYSTTGNLYLKNLLAIRGSVDTWLRINDANAFTSGTYFGQNTIRTDGTFQVGANGSAVNIYYQNGNSNKAMTVSIPATFNGATTTISNLVAPIATINNATISGDLTVNGVLQANDFIKNIVKAVGGQLYVSPTFQALSSTTVTCTAVTATQLSLTLSDNAINGTDYAGATWYKDSKVMLSGTITANTTGHTEEIIFSSVPGVVTANMSNSNKLQIKLDYDGANTYFKTGTLTTSDVAVMMYQINIPSGSTNAGLHPIGIYIKAYGTDNKNSYIDIFGGTSNTPNARLGLLTGLSAMQNGTTPSGWGIATTNGFFDGTIVSSSGKIGAFTLSSDLRSGTWGTSGSVLVAGGYAPTTADAKSIGGSPTTGNTWAFTAGNAFGVTTAGKIYASDAEISGKITATSGAIAGWRIESTYLASGTATAPAANTLLLSPAGTSSSYTVAGTAKSGWMITAGTTFGVNKDGGVYATSGKIGGWTLDASSLYTGTKTETSSIIVSSADVTRTINGASRTGLRLVVGSNFGVSNTGTLYANSANISGTLTAGNGSKIGDLTIANGKLSVPAANITGTLSADHIDTSSITIGQSQVDGLSTALGNKANSSTVTALSNKVTAVYGTCDTAANTQVKNVTCSNFEYFDGALITVAFSTANTYNVSTIRLNVNSKGQKNIKVANVITSADNCLLWGAGAVITFRYDGDYFVVVGEPRTWYGASTTAANTYVKTDTTAVAGCVVCKGTVVSLSMQHDNTVTTPFLNIAGTGNIELYAGDGTTTRPTTANGLGWTAGSTAQFIFDGQYWRVGDTAGLARAYSAQSTANTANTNATNAAKTATNYLTDITNDGVFVHESNGNNVTPSTVGANGVHISDEVDIIRNGEIVATYGEKIRLGKQAVAHSEFDEDSFTLFDTNHRIFAHLGGTNELVHLTSDMEIDKASDFENYTTPCYVFPLYTIPGISIPAERIVAVTSAELLKKNEGGYDTIPLVESEDYDVNGNVVTLLNEPVYYHDRLRVYVDISAMGDNTPFYTLGTRRTGSNNTSLTGIGDYSMAEGYNSYAQGNYSHAEGYTTDADGTASHAEGYAAGAYAMGAHAEGYGCNAGNWMYAEERRGDHAEGYMATANGGGGSHAEGYRSSAYGFASHAQNEYTETWARAQTVLGTFNEVDPSGSTTHPSGNLEYRQNAVMIGNGTDGDNRSNALTVDWSGNVWAAGKVMAENTSHVGMIIMSTTLDTMAKVISVYGGTTWIQHSGYFLYGASSGVTANHAAADGGEYTHTLTEAEMPSHGHSVFSYYERTAGQWDGLIYQSMYNSYNFHGYGNANFIGNTGGGQAHNNMPPYKQVYIWERTA